MSQKEKKLNKVATGVPGLDFILEGGIPENKISIVTGHAGTGKTLIISQTMWHFLKDRDIGGVFVTCDETTDEIKENVRSLGWNFSAYEDKGSLAFVDFSPQSYDLETEKELDRKNYSFEAIVTPIYKAVQKTGAKLVCIDAVGNLFRGIRQDHIVKDELLRLSLTLKKMQVTCLMTVGVSLGSSDEETAGHFSEYIGDCIVILRNRLQNEKRRRSVEILKVRGAMHQSGEFPFTFSPIGIEIMPLSSMQLNHHSSGIRISTGIKELDEMCFGGLFRDSITLVSGATGTGKTLTATTFVDEGCRRGEKSLYFAFEESREQLLRNAISWSKEFSEHENSGKLRVFCAYPEVLNLEDHLLLLKQEIDEFEPERVVIDSLSALERVSNPKNFREFVISFCSFVKSHQISCLVTNTTNELLGGTSITDTNISTLTDAIIVLRYAEIMGKIRRCCAVLKIRGSDHDKSLREFEITKDGIRLGKVFTHVSGILGGHPVFDPGVESRYLSQMTFEESEK